MNQDRPTHADLAATMDASPVLLPYLPELFIGVEDLGVRSSDVLSLLSLAELPERARVLDLGCGKGATLLELAQSLPVSGRGVDGFAPFVQHASERAQELGLNTQVRFDCGDIRALGEPPDLYDLVLLLALGPVYGDADETVARLRSLTRPGGYMLLDEAYLPGDLSPEDEHWDYGLSVEELADELTRHGDELVAELVYDTPEYRRWCGDVSELLRSRAQALATRKPEIADELHAFVERQFEETQAELGPFVGALFLLRRGVS